MRVTLSAAVLALAPMLAPIAVAADETGTSQADQLMDLMGIDQIIEIMRDEGLAYGAELAEGAGGGGEQWQGAVDRIYDADRMTQTVRVTFAETVEGTDMQPLIDFFETEGGQELVKLELSARAAMMDQAVEDAARDSYRAIAGSEDENARLELVTAFVEANDLVESNVVGALNSNIAFYNGLVDGGASDLSDEDILRDVWSQEEETRTETREWVYGFLLMAYRPIDDAVLQEYTDLSGTPAGGALNTGLFAGFDKMYGEISYALGLALAREMQVQEL